MGIVRFIRPFSCQWNACSDIDVDAQSVRPPPRAGGLNEGSWGRRGTEGGKTTNGSGEVWCEGREKKHHKHHCAFLKTRRTFVPYPAPWRKRMPTKEGWEGAGGG